MSWAGSPALELACQSQHSLRLRAAHLWPRVHPPGAVAGPGRCPPLGLAQEALQRSELSQCAVTGAHPVMAVTSAVHQEWLQTAAPQTPLGGCCGWRTWTWAITG